MNRCAIVDRMIDPSALLAEVMTDAAGATTLFLGTVRNVNEGRSVTGMEYSAYQAMAHEELQRIVAEAAAVFDGIRIVIEHRTGTLVVTDVSVAIAVAHARRAPAMDAQRFAIEALKERVPIWKCEHYADGDRHWVDPTAPRTVAASA